MTSFLGIQDAEKETYRDILKSFAATDNWHDFHHTNSAQVLDRLGKSYNVNSGLSVRQYQARVLALRTAFAGNTLYDMFKGYPSDIMLLGDTPEGLNAGSEDTVLDSLLPVGNKYTNIKSALVAAAASNPPKEFNLFGGANVNIGPKSRPYRISAAPVKNRGTVLNIASAFEKVSNNAVRNYILMIDASFLSISKLRSLVDLEAGTVYNFFIIQSIENDGDPATKITRFDDDNNQINVYFLKDTGHSTYYTPFDTGNGDASTLLSNCTISCTRSTDGSITADIKSDKVNTTIDNVGTASEPMEGGFLAFQRLLIKGTENKDEAFVYYLMKRAGDWCQALCLLDRGRQYTVETVGSSTPYNEANPITLQQLIDGLGAVEVGLLTHDKILLSYALLLGLNVFYTIKVAAAAGADDASNTVIWLTYFKNTLDSNPAAILNAANEKYENIKNDIIKITSFFDTNKENFNLDSEFESMYGNLLNIFIQLINRSKEEEEEGTYKPNSLSDFLRDVRIVLDYIVKISVKPSESMNTIWNGVENELKTEENALEYFRIVSQAETNIHIYLQMIEYIKNLSTLYETIPESFANEVQKIQELEGLLQKGISFNPRSNESLLEPYQYFLFTTAPAIKKDIQDFITKFSLTEEQITPLYEALQFDTTKYRSVQDIRSARKRSEWQANINAWYQSYANIIGLPEAQGGGAYVQKGGNTDFDIAVFIPLQKHYIKTRESYIDNVDTMKQTLESDLRNYYNFPMSKPNTRFIDFLTNTAEQYYDTVKDLLKEPHLSQYVNEVILDFADRVIESTGETEETVVNNFDETKLSVNNIQSLNTLSQQSIDEYKPFYFTPENEPKYDTMLDHGTTVTYNDGQGFTVLDNFLITNDSIPIWQRWINYEGALESRVPYTIDFIFHRFLLFNLDLLTNTVHEVHEHVDGDVVTYDDTTMKKMKQINSSLDFIKDVLNKEATRQQQIEEQQVQGQQVQVYPFNQYNNNQILNTKRQHFSEGFIDYTTFFPSLAKVTKEKLLLFLAKLKVDVICSYYAAIKLKGAKKILNNYQIVRLLYLLSPASDVDTIKKYRNYLLNNYVENGNEIKIAYVLSYINFTGQTPDEYNNADMQAAVQEHLNVYEDDFYKRVKTLLGQAGGKRKTKRYRKTRSKKRTMRKKRGRGLTIRRH